MKIKITEIEANATDLKASQTLGTAFSNALRNAFANIGAYEEQSYEDDDEDEERKE